MRFFVLVTDAFGGRGGIAKFNRDLLTALCSAPGCKSVTAIPRLIVSDPGVLPEKLNYLREGINGKVKYMITVLSNALRRQDIDLIICGHINLLPAAFLARLFLRAPVALVIHGIDAWAPTRSSLTNRLVKMTDHFMAVSEFTKKRFLEWTMMDKGKGSILPNCVALDLYAPGPKGEKLLKKYGLANRQVVMTMGRISADEKYKGFDEVLEALPELAREIPDVSYVIAGDGTDRQRLEDKAKSLGVADRVVFTGWISQEEKAEHIRLADAFVMPGRGEGFGIVFLEAMACGVPVVASKIDGSREAVREGELGFLADPSNRKELISAIIAALQKPKGVPEGLDYFSFTNFKKRLYAIIDQMLKGRKQDG